MKLGIRFSNNSRGALKQGFEAITEQGCPIVRADVGDATITITPGASVSMKVVCFIALEPFALVLEGVTRGLQQMTELQQAHVAEVQVQQSLGPRIVKPGGFFGEN